MNAEAPIVVHIVDDDAGMRLALSRLLGAAGYATRSYASAGEYLIAEPDARTGCLLLDLDLGGPSGLDLQAALQRQSRALPVVFLTGRGDIAASVRALKAGASDFLTKPVQGEVLLAAIEAALAADAPQRAERERRQALALRYASLSARERSVLQQVVQGRLTKQIASALGVSERTVKACRAEMMAKLGAHSLPELVRIAAELPPG
jgi:FixJ family two-component response regulator